VGAALRFLPCLAEARTKEGPVGEESLRLDRLRAGDRATWAFLINRLSAEIEARARRLVRDDELDDFLQHLWEHLFASRAQFQGAADSPAGAFQVFRAWAHTATERQARNWRRGEGSRRRGEPVSQDAEAPWAGPLSVLLAAELRELVRALPDDQRLIVELHVWDGEPFTEIAERGQAGDARLPRDRETVSKRYHAALRELQRRLGP
jgi:RNA polymerase sigma factor (sigma-70 family)